MKIKDRIDEQEYENRSREELLRLCVAYARGMHDLADRCMAAEGKLQMIERNVLMSDGFRS